MPYGDFLVALLGEAHASGASLAAWALAWARSLPTVLLVPAFGLAALPVPLRAAFGLGLSASIVAAVRPLHQPAGAHFAVSFVFEAIRGVPVALVASVSLWAASVAGGLTDHALGLAPRRGPRGVSGGGPLNATMGLFAGIAFLETGGAARVAERLSADPLEMLSPLARGVEDLALGLQIGAALAVPVLLVSAMVELGFALSARELPPLGGPGVVAPVRSLAILLAAAALFEAAAESLARLAARYPG